MIHYLLTAVASLGAACQKPGAECTPGKGLGACCNTSATLPYAKCEVVDQYYSKCVWQPVCAAANQQCKGAGQSVFEATSCCDKAFVCRNVSKYYSSCVNASAPPPPPPPPPAKCAIVGAQCGGSSGGVHLPCCNKTAACEAESPFFSKCVEQPTCAAQSADCAGAGEHVMKTTACCNKTDTCVAWGDVPPNTWSECRAKGHETCADHQEQCAGTGGSAMKEKACCNPKEKCIKKNDYYSDCDVAESCAATNTECKGTGKHVMDPTKCCDATSTCVAWGDEWSLCRAKGHETCSDSGEQCKGDGDSKMKEKPCCTATETCQAVNPFYSKCA